MIKSVFSIFSGPIVSYMVTKFEYGHVTIVGAILSTASMIGAIFCEKLILLYITFGFLTGECELNFKFKNLFIISSITV